MEHTVGRHCICELYGCPFEHLNDAKYIEGILEQGARVSKSTLLGIQVHSFDPIGVTGLALLAESHISIHTWPEKGYAAVDFFSCGEHTLPEQACHFIRERLKARDYSLQILSRGEHTPKGHMSVMVD